MHPQHLNDHQKSPRVRAHETYYLQLFVRW